MNSGNDQINIPIEMGTSINQIKSNRQINVNNLVKNVETNIDNLERTRNIETTHPSFQVGGYQYEHQQLMNQSNNPIIETIAPVQHINMNQQHNNLQNQNTIPITTIGNNYINHNKDYISDNSWFTFLNRELFLIILLFSLFSHRKFNTLIARFIPLITDSRFYTLFVLIKGVLFSLILSIFKKV